MRYAIDFCSKVFAMLSSHLLRFLFLVSSLSCSASGISPQMTDESSFLSKNAPSQSVAFSSDQLNLSSPLSFAFSYSQLMGSYFTLGYGRVFGARKHEAVSLHFEHGGHQNRANITFARQIDSHQRIKVSVERLSQQRSFDFYSGMVKSWVAQYAGGMTYAWAGEKNGIIKEIDINSYFARSIGKSLPSLLYNELTPAGIVKYEDLRRIAGANAAGVRATASLSLWYEGLITLGLSYDSLQYRADYSQHEPNTSGVGFIASLQQALARHVSLLLTYSNKKTLQDLQAELLWSVLTSSHYPLQMGLTAERVSLPGDVNDRQLSLSAQLSLTPQSNLTRDDHPVLQRLSLQQWVNLPAVYMPGVFATADEKRQAVALKWCGTVHASSKSVNEESLSWCSATEPSVMRDSLQQSSSRIHYHVVISEQSKNSSALGKVVYSNDVNQTSIVVPNLHPNQYYVATVTVIDENGYAPLKASTDFTTEKTHLSWDEKSISISNIQRDSAMVNFNADAKSSDAFDIISYQVDCEDDKGHQSVRNIASPASVDQHETIDHLLPGVSYHCHVTVSDSDNEPEIESEVAHFITRSDVMTWNGADTVSVNRIYSDHATVSWNANAASTNPNDGIFYVVYLKDMNSGEVREIGKVSAQGNASYLMSSLKPAHQYQAWIVSEDTLGKDKSIHSNISNFSNILNWPGQGSVAVSDVSASSAVAAWSEDVTDTIPGAKITYIAKLFTSAGGLLSTTQAAHGYWNLSELQPGVNYYVVVTAKDDRGLSLQSNKLFFKTNDNEIIWENTGIQASILNDEAMLSWNPASPPSSHKASALIEYRVKVTGDQSDKVYIDQTQSDRSAVINKLLSVDQSIHVEITAFDNEGDIPKTVSESIPLSRFTYI